MSNTFHQNILQNIKQNAGKGTRHTFADSYLGNSHPRYAITAPVLRRIAKEWMAEHHELSSEEFSALVTSLVNGESSTEKVFAGILMDYSTMEQRDFDPRLFDQWIEQLEGWAEIDAVCTGKYTVTHIPLRWKEWKMLLKKFSKDGNIHKRRASLVLFCSPVRHNEEEAFADVAFENIERLQSEKSILITKAISWLLRSLIKYHKKRVAEFLKENSEKLPKIAIRETIVKLKTGTKTKSKSKSNV